MDVCQHTRSSLVVNFKNDIWKRSISLSIPYVGVDILRDNENIKRPNTVIVGQVKLNNENMAEYSPYRIDLSSC